MLAGSLPCVNVSIVMVNLITHVSDTGEPKSILDTSSFLSELQFRTPLPTDTSVPTSSQPSSVKSSSVFVPFTPNFASAVCCRSGIATV